MKSFILAFILIFFNVSIFSQSLSSNIETSLRPKKDGDWDLSKYVWSHTLPVSRLGNKPVLDFNAIDNWIQVGRDEDVCISPDAKYFTYSVEKTVSRKQERFMVQSMFNTWQQQFMTDDPGFFSKDSKFYIFKYRDTLCFLQLGENNLRNVHVIASYKISGDKEWIAYQLKDNQNILVLQNLLTGMDYHFENVFKYEFDKTGKWLACQLKNKTNELIIYNLTTNYQQRFISVVEYRFHETGKAALIKTVSNIPGSIVEGLQYVPLVDSNNIVGSQIWSSENSTYKLSDYIMDKSGQQIVFILQSIDTAKIANHKNANQPPVNEIWYWKIGMGKAEKRVINEFEAIDGALVIDKVVFTDGGYVICTIQPLAEILKPKPDAVQIEIWNYKDTILQSKQIELLKTSETYRAIINIEKSAPVFVENKYVKLKFWKGDFAVVGKIGKEIYGDRFWEKGYRMDSNWLVSLKDGTRTLLKTEEKTSFLFSPKGNYLVYFDADKGCNYFSYNLHTGKVINLSEKVPALQLGLKTIYILPNDKPVRWAGVAGWLEDDKGLLVYDNHDLWRLDPAGKRIPLNVTNGFGRSHNIIFYLEGAAPIFRSGSPGLIPVFSERESLLLQAFNLESKQKGFYLKELESDGNPELLYMGPYMLDIIYSNRAVDKVHIGNELAKNNNNTIIVKRQTATEAPNYYLTTNFKRFSPLTNVQPQKKYNWLTAELHSFRQLDGTISQGILYKPENFDPAKKYPVIISFYGVLTDQMYQFPQANYLNRPNIWDSPGWMVSHGYLVFMPDIYFTKEKYGPSVLNTLDGAAKYLGKLPYVDSKRIGASGHSNSGRFGYYVLTHSRSFAAMCLGSGFGGTNVLSLALSLDHESKESNLYWGEKGAFGAALGNIWQNKASWIDHTAVLQADKVNCPLLLFHNKRDADDVRLAVELFTAFWRLGKMAWWLQYDDGTHTLRLIKDKKDFTIRYTQYFDHFLKGAPAPLWMKEGIPARLKGVENYYELGYKGSCGLDCKICKNISSISDKSNSKELP
jgi:dienelactone hydrolase